MKTESQTDFRGFWQLDAAPRFPMATVQWNQTVMVTCPNPRQLNASIAAAQRLLASRKLPQLRAECWRLAYYYRRSGHETCRSIVWSVLEGCRSGGWLEDVPAEWIGTTCIEPVVTELFEAVTVMDLEHAEAVGAILRLYRSVPLEKNEVLRLPWFEPSYLSAFVGKVQALTHVPSLSL